MATQEVRNKSGKLLGKISEKGGKLEIRNPSGKYLGRFDPKKNETRNSTGKMIMKGNGLITLL